MELGKNIRVLKLLTGEIIITEIKEVTDDNMYILDYAGMIIPIPAEQAGGQPNQIGFAKFMPFSDNTKDITLNPVHILSDSEPHGQILAAYEKWIDQIKSQESGIIRPSMVPPAGDLKSGKGNPIRPNFRNGLNIG